jgi:hypothetical protein
MSNRKTCQPVSFGTPRHLQRTKWLGTQQIFCDVGFLMLIIFYAGTALSHFPGMFDLSNFEQSWPEKLFSSSLKRRIDLWPFRGPNWTVRDLGRLAMFQIPAYDPVPIVMMGFGVLLAVALAFVL